MIKETNSFSNFQFRFFYCILLDLVSRHKHRKKKKHIRNKHCIAGIEIGYCRKVYSKIIQISLSTIRYTHAYTTFEWFEKKVRIFHLFTLNFWLENRWGEAWNLKAFTFKSIWVWNFGRAPCWECGWHKEGWVIFSTFANQKLNLSCFQPWFMRKVA